MTIKKNAHRYSFLLLTLFLLLVDVLFLFVIAPYYNYSLATVKIFLLISVFLFLVIPLIFSAPKSFVSSENWKTTLLEWGLAAQLLSLLVDTSIAIWGTLFFTICTMLYFFFTKKKSIKLYCWPVSIFFFVFFALRVIGLLWADDKSYGLDDVWRSLSFVLYPLLFSIVHFSEKSTLRLTKLFTRGTLLFCLISILKGFYIASIENTALLYWLQHSKEFLHYITSWQSEAMHPTFVAMALITAYIAAAYLRTKKIIPLVEYAILSVLIISYILLSGSRMGLLCFLVAVAADFILFFRLALWKKAIVCAIGATVCIVFILNVPSQITNTEDPIRKNMRQTGVEVIKERPLTGYGTGGYSVGYKRSVQNAIDAGRPEDACFTCFHLHNQYVDETVQYGILWLVVFAGWLLLLLWKSVRMCDYPLLIFLVIQILHMFSDSPLLMQREITLFTFVICFFALPFFQKKSIDVKND